MKAVFLLLASAAAVSAEHCVSDKDCPQSYCVNDPTKTAPFSCHGCGDGCYYCKSDADCKGSYCMNDATKSPPYKCHNSEVDPITLLLQDAPTAPAPASPDINPEIQKDKRAIEDFLSKYKQFVAGVSIAVGLVFAFAGYKFFDGTLFLVGAATAGFLSYAVMQHYMYEIENNQFNLHISPTVLVIVTSVLALLGGLLTWKLRKLGTFFAGAAGGCAGAVMLNTAVLINIPAPDDVPSLWLYISMVVLGVIGGALALKIERPVLILATSLAGSLGTVMGVGHFAGNFPTNVDSFVNNGVVSHNAWVWGYAGGFVLLVLASIVVQFKTTGDAKKKKRDDKYKNSLLYSAPRDNTSGVVYVDHVSGYHTAV